jgi:ABC-type branched-subunit amino acid transport system ATPase component
MGLDARRVMALFGGMPVVNDVELALEPGRIIAGLDPPGGR